MKSLKAKLSVLRGIISALYASTVTGPAIDLANFASNSIVFEPGVITDGTHTPKVTECDTVGGSYTDVAAGDLDGTLAALASNTLQSVGYIGTKRFLKLVVTVTGSPATGGQYSASVVHGGSRVTPV